MQKIVDIIWNSKLIWHFCLLLDWPGYILLDFCKCFFSIWEYCTLLWDHI